MRQLSGGFRTTGLVLAAVLFEAASSGCGRSSSAQGYLSVPQANSVRLIPGNLNATTPDRLHWTWSVLGERNWTRAQASGLRLALSDSYPLNDVQRMHGSNTWNCDLIAERRAADPTVAHWTLTLHGSNGMTAQSTGAAPLNGQGLDGVIIQAQTSEQTDSLPASVTLASVNNANVTLDLSK